MPLAVEQDLKLQLRLCLKDFTIQIYAFCSGKLRYDSIANINTLTKTILKSDLLYAAETY